MDKGLSQTERVTSERTMGRQAMHTPSETSGFLFFKPFGFRPRGEFFP